MKDRIVLSEKDFHKAVLVVVVLLMTLVCLHIFVMQSDAAEMSKVFTNTITAEKHGLIQMGEIGSTTHQFITT
jgi:UDP-glucose 6-dehydrogenase